MVDTTQSISAINIAEEFEVNSEFATIEEFVNSFSISALSKEICYIVKQRNKTSVSLGCSQPECTFKVRARYVISAAACLVKHMHPFHSCMSTNVDKIQPCAIGKVIKTLNIDEISSIGLIAKMSDYGSVKNR